MPFYLLQTLACEQTAIRSPGLPFNGLNPEIQLLITTHLPTPDGRKAELAWLVDPYSGHFTH